MKKTAEILGLPVISITEGKELGHVKELVVNAAAGTVAAIVVDDGKWYLGAKLLPFGAVAGIGEYALTIDSSSHVISITAAPELEALLAANVKVIGSKVLTRSGRIQGKVTEFNFDLSGKIVSCEIEESTGSVVQINGQQVITYGKEVLIIAEGSAEIIEPRVATTQRNVVESISVQPVVPVVPQPANPPAEENTSTSVANATTQSASAPNDPPADDSARKFDEKHRKYLLGKKANRRIETDSGMVIVEQGGEITEEVLQKAKLAGKFVELSMSI